MKTELAIKFDAWLETQKDCGMADLSSDEIAEAAFLAGAQANEEVREEICIKLAAE
jgi:hypothetical protein